MRRSSRNGYLMPPKDATVHTIPEPAPKQQGRFERLFTSWSNDRNVAMFVKDTLDVTDIHQGQIGNCWFLAGAASIIGHPWGTRLLKGCVIDCEDGWVIVRLFDGDLNPVYIRTRKTRASFMGAKSGVTGVHKTGFWSAALEKAASVFTKTSDRRKIDVRNPSMTNTESGNPSEAFRMLLGCEVTEQVMSDVNIGGVEAQGPLDLILSNWGDHEVTQVQSALRAILGGGVSLDTWKTHRQKVRQAVAMAKLSSDPGKISPAGVPSGIVQGIVGYIRANRLWDKAYVGSGIYSARAEELYRTISSKIAGDCPVGFTTRKDIGKAQGTGHSGGETLSFGMAGEHCYAVLDTFAENVMARRKFIKVCNPWGRYGRAYKDADDGNAPSLDPKEQESGVFWMELSDFANAGVSLSIGSPIDFDTALRVA
jgi:hypothetical protein